MYAKRGRLLTATRLLEGPNIKVLFSFSKLVEYTHYIMKNFVYSLKNLLEVRINANNI